jgi:type II secretory pathway pseudopilin PulG
LELLVVLSVVGVLAQMSISSYNHFQAKARSAEAKLALAALYTAELTYSGENLSYTACLANIGFVPDGLTRYFRVGFSSTQAAGTTCGPTGNQACNQVNWGIGGGGGTPCSTDSHMNAGETFAYPATALMVGATALPTDADMPQTFPLTRSDFTAGAVSNSFDIAALDYSDGAYWAGVAVAALDGVESQAVASPGNGNGACNGQGNINNGSCSGSGSTQTCTNQKFIWTIDANKTFALGTYCLQ